MMRSAISVVIPAARFVLAALLLASAPAWTPATGHAQEPSSTTVLDPSPVQTLAWMTGCWEAALSGGATYEEAWMAPRGGMMLGTARMIRQGRVLSWEFLQIWDDGQGPVYVARPSGQPPTGFRAVHIDGASATFENPEHDFPQRILYRSTPPGQLDVRIEGDADGELQGMDFPLRRVGCGPSQETESPGIPAP